MALGNSRTRYGSVAMTLHWLIAFAIYDMGHSALAYLGVDASATAVEFGTCLPKTGAIKAGAMAI